MADAIPAGIPVITADAGVAATITTGAAAANSRSGLLLKPHFHFI